MRHTTILFIGFLTMLTALLGYNYFFQPFARLQGSPDVSPVPSPPPPAQDAISLAQQQLTTREKIAQLLAVPLTITDEGRVAGWENETENIEQVMVDNTSSISGEVVSELAPSIQQVDQASTSARIWLAEHKPGFVTLFGDTISAVTARRRITEIREAVPGALALQVAVDHEGGSVQRLAGDGFTKLPTWQEQCTENISEIAQSWRTSAQELNRAGVDIVFAPVVDFASAHPVLGSRVCSSDPEQVSAYSLEYARAFSSNGILPVYKHFPGIGQTSRDLHRAFDTVTIGAEEAELYRTLLTNDVPAGVMITHVGVTNQYEELPCSLSRDCIAELEFVSPDSLKFTDALEMEAALVDERTLAQAAEEALWAGNHVLVFGEGVSLTELSEILDRLVQQYEADYNFREQVDLAIEKVLETKIGE